MPLNVGDAVLTFLGDTTQLDQAFTKVNQDAATKLGPAADAATGVGTAMTGAGEAAESASGQITGAWERVAQATIANQQAQQWLRDAIAVAASAGAQDVAVMNALASAERQAAAAAIELAAARKAATQAQDEENESTSEGVGSLALIGDLTGVKLPRHLRSFVAELPGVGAALSAAFSFVAISALVGVLVEGIAKLQEWMNASEQLREDWIKIDATFQDTSDTMQSELDKQGEKIVQLTQGPVAGMDFAMQHLRSTAINTLKSISSELQALSDQFSKQSSLFDFGGGLSAIKKQLEEFSADLTDVMHKAEREAPGDTTAAYRAGIKRTEEEIKAVNDQIEHMQKMSASGWGDADLASNKYFQGLNKELDHLKEVQRQLEMGQQEDVNQLKIDQDEKAKLQNQYQIAVVEATKQGALAELELAKAQNAALYEEGKRSFDQQISSLTDFENQKYQIEKSSLEKKKSLELDPSQRASIDGQLRALEAQHQQSLLQIDVDSYKHNADAYASSMREMIASTRNGTQERLDLEIGLAQYLGLVWGTESSQYKEQLNRIAEARRALSETQRKLAEEDAQAEQKLAADKRSADDKYYAYLVQTARMTSAQLLQIQQQEAEAEYQRKRQALEIEQLSLGDNEKQARQKVMHEIELLDQQHQETLRLNALQTEDVLEGAYRQLGLKSADLWSREVAQAQQAYDTIQKSGTATYAQLLQAQEKLLQTKISLAISQGDDAALQKYTGDLAKLQQQMDKMGLSAQKTSKSMSDWLNKFAHDLQATRGQLSGFQSTFDTVIGSASDAFGNAVSQWIQGQESLGEALRKGLAAELATIAGKAAAWSLYFAAWGIADIFWDPARAGADFAAAAEFAALAGIAGAAAYAIAPRSSATNSGTTSASSSSNSVGTQPAPTPVQAVNVQHFAGGALVSQPTYAVIGDAMNGANQAATEAVLPLTNPIAMKGIADALGPYLAANGGGDTHNHFYVQGLISPDNLSKVVRQISSGVKKNQVTLYSSNSFRVTKRSV